MKTLIALLFLLTSFAESSVVISDGPQTYAVIVGISNYTDPGITALKFAHRDAESFANFLKSPKGGSVPDKNVVLLTNADATRATILGALRTQFQNATSEDVIIFYYAGHGIPDAKISRELYFTTYDSQKSNIIGTALLKDQVEMEFVNSPAKLKLFVADACHSGGTGIYLGTRDDAAELTNRLTKTISEMNEPGWAALTAASRSELSIEDEKWGGGHGVFTYFLIKGLEGEADKVSSKNLKAKGDGNGIVTVREIHEYLSNTIPAETNGKQHPDKQAVNEDVFPVSAVTPNQYAVAVGKYEKVSKILPALTTDSKPISAVSPNLDTATLDLEKSVCNPDGNYIYGELRFINTYKEDLLLYYIDNHKGSFPLNVLLSVGEKSFAGNFETNYLPHGMIKSRDVKLYFKTVDESKPIKYGAFTFNVATCKVRTYLLTNKNIYLSENGAKR